MYCAAPTICLLWGVWGVDSGRLILESWWHCRAAIPLSQVTMDMRYCVWYRYSEPVVGVISVIICDYGGVVMRIVDLHNGDVVL